MVTLITSAIRLFAVFLFGSVGEIITEKSGHLNLGTPGVMCFGGIGGCIGISLAVDMVGIDNGFISGFIIILFAIIFTIIFGALVGLLYSFLTVTLRANQNITGLAITTFGVASANFFSKKIERNNLMAAANNFFVKMFPVTSDSADAVQILFGYGFLVYLAIIVAVLTSLFLVKTRRGLGLRAVGENPATADAAGLNVSKYRYMATIVGSAIAGFGGLAYIMDYSNGLFEQAVTIETLGWLAVALVIFSTWRPSVAILGSLIFAILYVLPYSSLFQMDTTTMEVIKMLPYIVTAIVLIITSILGRRQVQPPASLGINYFREDR